MQGYLHTTADLTRNAKRRATLLGLPGAPFSFSSQTVPGASPNFGGMDFGAALRQRGSTANLPTDFSPGGGQYPPQRKMPGLPAFDTQSHSGMGIGDMVGMAGTADSVGSLLKGQFSTGHPINFGQYGELGADVNTFNAAGTGAVGGAGTGAYVPGSVEAAQLAAEGGAEAGGGVVVAGAEATAKAGSAAGGLATLGALKAGEFFVRLFTGQDPLLALESTATFGLNSFWR